MTKVIETTIREYDKTGNLLRETITKTTHDVNEKPRRNGENTGVHPVFRERGDDGRRKIERDERREGFVAPSFAIPYKFPFPATPIIIGID